MYIFELLLKANISISDICIYVYAFVTDESSIQVMGRRRCKILKPTHEMNSLMSIESTVSKLEEDSHQIGMNLIHCIVSYNFGLMFKLYEVLLQVNYLTFKHAIRVFMFTCKKHLLG